MFEAISGYSIVTFYQRPTMSSYGRQLGIHIWSTKPRSLHNSQVLCILPYQVSAFGYIQRTKNQQNSIAIFPRIDMNLGYSLVWWWGEISDDKMVQTQTASLDSSGYTTIYPQRTNVADTITPNISRAHVTDEINKLFTTLPFTTHPKTFSTSTFHITTTSYDM